MTGGIKKWVFFIIDCFINFVAAKSILLLSSYLAKSERDSNLRREFETTEDIFFKVRYMLSGGGFSSWVRDIPVEEDIDRFMRSLQKNQTWFLESNALKLKNKGITLFVRQYKYFNCDLIDLY